MCESIPSVTIYGTTQYTTLTTYTTTLSSVVAKDPVITLITTTDSNGLPSSQLVTTNPLETSTWTSVIAGQKIITSLVPQSTLYYPCPTTTATSTAAAAGAEETSSESESEGGIQTQATVSTSSSIGQFVSPTSTSTTQTTLSTTGTGTLPAQFTATSLTSSSSASATNSNGNAENQSSVIRQQQSTAITSHTASANTNANTITIASSTTTSSSTALGDSTKSHSSSSSGTIAGGVAGSVVAVLLLIALVLFCRKKRRQRNDRRSGYDNEDINEGGGDYWERRFRALEAQSGDGHTNLNEYEDDDEDEKGQGREGVEDDWELKSSRKLHLTLDLASKSLPSRPASRLSAISTFFASKVIATSTQLSNDNNVLTGKGTSDNSTSGLNQNFSRPLKGWRKTMESINNDIYPKSPKSKRRSSKLSTSGYTNKSTGSSSGSAKRKSRSNSFLVPPFNSTGLGLGGSSLSPFSFTSHSSSTNTNTDVDGEMEEGDIRKGMEWMRHSDSDYRLDPDQAGQIIHHHGDSLTAGENGGYPSPRALRRISGPTGPTGPAGPSGLRPPPAQTRKTLRDVQPRDESPDSGIISIPSRSTSTSSDSSQRSFGHSRPPSDMNSDEHDEEKGRSLTTTPPGQTRTLYPPTRPPGTTNGPPPPPRGRASPNTITNSETKTRALGPSKSLTRNRERKGKNPVPQLSLSRQATTPSLWVDDDVDRTPKCKSNDRGKGMISQFSASTVGGDERSPEAGNKSDVYGGLAPSPPSTSNADVREKGKGKAIPSPKSAISTAFSTTSSLEESHLAQIIGIGSQSRLHIDRSERSAVTPQLPVLSLGSSSLDHWDLTRTRTDTMEGNEYGDGDGDGEMERMKSVYVTD